jgi:hypothetical protein
MARVVGTQPSGRTQSAKKTFAVFSGPQKRPFSVKHLTIDIARIPWKSASVTLCDDDGSSTPTRS